MADELFATLDSTVGELFLPQSRKKMIVADTIGFIQDLPPDLIDAFKSTLAEIIEADIIFHVIDTSDENIFLKIQVVEDIMAQIGVISEDKDKYYIFNKMDKLDRLVEEGDMTLEKKEELIFELKARFSEYKPIFISATDKSSLQELIADMDAKALAAY